MTPDQKTIHASVHLEPKLHRALTTKLFKERRSLSEFFREAAVEFVGKGK